MSKSDENPKRLNRRQSLLMPAAGMGAAFAAEAADSTKTAAHQAPGGCSAPRSAIAKTQYGKVRGYIDAGVFTFKGIPYGQNTAGENRWLPAKPPKPWDGEYPALIYGANSTYNIRVARPREVTGPYLDKMKIDALKGGGKLVVAASGCCVWPGHFGPDGLG